MVKKLGIGLAGLLIGIGSFGAEEAVAQQSPGEGRAIGGIMRYMGRETVRPSDPIGQFGGQLMGIAGEAIQYEAEIEAQKEINRAGRPQQNINVNVNTGRPSEKRELPVNVVRNENGTYRPAQGYEWIDPEDKKDLRVRKKQVSSNLYSTQDSGSISPRGDIKRVEVLHNEIVDGERGMVIRTCNEMFNLVNSSIEVGVFFKDDNGNYLRDKDRQFYNSQGFVYFSRSFIPPEAYCWTVKDISIPYSQLDLRSPGRNDLTGVVVLNVKTPTSATQLDLETFPASMNVQY